jgi:phage shock protein PspC (stress-responsive transcriptional regulator)
MNKTIIININGIVFHIEEDAYEILKEYMTNVKRHFLNSADSLEITTDIENRIAEMFSDILTHENKQVIVEQDVQSVIEQMGTVDEFDEIYEDAKADTSNAYAFNAGERRLFRDPDDHLVSGVCAGIANYFNIEPVWIRLAFALSVFFAGSGLLLYIILWIVIPRATTRADRMAMKGEKLNLQGFKNSFEEEMTSVRNHLNNLGQEAQPFVYKLRDFIGDFAHHLGLFFNGAGKIIVKVLGAIILLTFFAGAIALVVALVAFLGFGAGHANGMFPMSIWMNEHADRIYIAAFLTAFIPVVSIILMLISAVFNTGPIGRSTGTTLLVAWICSLAVLVFYVAKVGANFRETASFTQTINIKPTPDNVYYMKINNVKYLTHDDSLRLDVKNHFRNMILTNDFDDDSEPRNINVSIERSDISQPVIIESFTAKGRTYESALMNARNTRYIYLQQDSVLKFDDKLRRDVNESWHAEYLDITIKLPLNAKVVIDQDLNNRINLNNVNVNDCKNLNKQGNATSAAFIMTDDGLQCKVDTLVTVKPQAQIDSARKANSIKTINKLQAQLDSARKADSVVKHK